MHESSVPSLVKHVLLRGLTHSPFPSLVLVLVKMLLQMSSVRQELRFQAVLRWLIFLSHLLMSQTGTAVLPLANFLRCPLSSMDPAFLTSSFPVTTPLHLALCTFPVTMIKKP